MKVTLNVQEDAELRAHVKEVIKGQITSIIRDELKNIINEQVAGLIENTSTQRIEQYFQIEILKIVRETLSSDRWSNNSQKVYQKMEEVVKDEIKQLLSNPSKLKEIDIKIVSEFLKNISKDDIINAIVKKLIKDNK